MKLSAYDALIARLERSAAASPSWYRTRVALFAGLGYALVALMLLVGVALVLGALAVMVEYQGRRGEAGMIKLALVLGILGGVMVVMVVRGAMAGFPAPAGVMLRREQALDLFAEVEAMRASLGAPTVHRVVIAFDFNAALYQRPLLGLFGWYRNHLILGLTLLRQSSPAQARYVIAHELAHLHGRHGRFSAWMHRLRVTWDRLAGSEGKGWFARFLRWYAPLFNAWTFVLARLHEREADRLATTISGAEAAGSALMRAAVVEKQLAGFWQGLSRQALHDAQVPTDIGARLDRFLAEPPAHAKRWMAQALTRGNDRQDPHPCLRERLDLVGCPPMTMLKPPTRSASAAHIWLGADELAIATQLDQEWTESSSAAWVTRHQEGQRFIGRRASLEADRRIRELTIDEQWELVRLVHELDGADVARSELEALLKRQRNHAGALFTLGCDLLEQDDADGVAVIEAAMKADPEAILAGTTLIRDFADAHGRADLIERAERRGEERSELEMLAQAERSKLPKPAALVAHGIDDAALASLRGQLALHSTVAACDLARVQTVHLPDRPWYIVGVRIRVAWWRMRSVQHDGKIIAALVGSVVLPGEALFLTDKVSWARSLLKRLKKLPGARIYQRDTKR